MSTVSANMSLTIPTATVTPGPEFALNINSDLSIIDTHDHTTNKGVAIPSAGININSDLPFNTFNATLLRSTRYAVQTPPISLPSDLGCVYVSGVDLYFNDVSGNQIRLTQSGGVAGAPGSISGLSSPASASYNSGSQKFIWQSAALTSANMDFGSAILRNNTPSSFGLTLAPPVLANNYSITLPTLPAASSFMQIDASGNISNTIPVANGITRSNQAAVGQQFSASCESWLSTGSTSFENVGSLSLSITTTGRPVVVGIMSYGSNTATVGMVASSTALAGLAGTGIFSMTYQVLRGTTSIGTQSWVLYNQASQQTTYMPPNYNVLDAVSAGTYTYQVQAISNVATSGAGGGGGTRMQMTWNNVKLFAYEL